MSITASLATPVGADDFNSAYAGGTYARATFAIKATHTVFTSTDGFTKVAQLAADIFSIIEAMCIAFAESIKAVGTTLKAFLDLTSIVSLFKRCKEWFLPDEDGKMFWQRAWQAVASLACLTGSNILTFINFLATTLKVVNLGKALAPCALLGNVLTIFSSSFDIWQSANKLSDVSAKTAKAVAAKEEWSGLVKDLSAGSPLPQKWIGTIQKQKAIWDRCIKNCQNGDVTKLQHAQSERACWEALEKNPDGAEAKAFCNRNIVKLEVELDQHRITKIKNWVYIAASVALIALTIICIVMSVVTPAGILIALLVAGVAASVSDLTSYLLDEFLKPRKV
jgi:hypothetical protein